MAYRRKDAYYRRAKREGFRSRASYKLSEIDARFRIMRRGDTVIDLGAAPGGWSQVAVAAVGPGNVVAVDRRPMEPIEGVRFLQMDVFTPELVAEIAASGMADLVLSDMAPDITGAYSMDHARSVHLAERVLDLLPSLLRPGGRAVVKVFQGDLFEDLLARYRSAFRRVRCFSPRASRRSSSETYMICLGFRGAASKAGGDGGEGG